MIFALFLLLNDLGYYEKYDLVTSYVGTRDAIDPIIHLVLRGLARCAR